MTDEQRDFRYLPLEGAHNFRRIEGWRDEAGRTIRPGLLFRSSGLQNLTDQDQAQVRDLAIAHVFDLRGIEERERDPSRWHPEAMPTIWADAESAAAGDLMRNVRHGNPTVASLSEISLRVYSDFPADLGPAVSAVLSRMLESEGSALLIHCSAGKDRTGFVVASVLRALGIIDADVRADYLLTNQCYAAACRRFSKREHLQALEEREPGAMEVLLRAEEAYFDAADARIMAQWGSFDNYLADVAGLDAQDREQLRKTYLQPR